MGPSAIRYAELEARIRELGRDCVDLGNVLTAVAEAAPVGDTRTRYLREILTACERVAERVRAARDEGRMPLVLGGDHSVALGHARRPRRRVRSGRRRSGSMPTAT